MCYHHSLSIVIIISTVILLLLLSSSTSFFVSAAEAGEPTKTTLAINEQTSCPYEVSNQAVIDDASQLVLNGFIPPFCQVTIKGLTVHSLVSNLVFFPGSALIIDGITTTHGSISILSASSAEQTISMCANNNRSHVSSFMMENSWWPTNDFFKNQVLTEDPFTAGEKILTRQRLQNITVIVQNCVVNYEWYLGRAINALDGPLKAMEVARQLTCPYEDQNLDGFQSANSILNNNDQRNELRHVATNETQLHLHIRNNKITMATIDGTTINGMIALDVASAVQYYSSVLFSAAARIFEVEISNNIILVHRPTNPTDERGRIRGIQAFATFADDNAAGCLFYTGPYRDSFSSSPFDVLPGSSSSSSSSAPLPKYQLPSIRMQNNKVEVHGHAFISTVIFGRYGFQPYSVREEMDRIEDNTQITREQKHAMMMNIDVTGNSLRGFGNGEGELFSLQLEYPLRTRVTFNNNDLFSNFTLTKEFVPGTNPYMMAEGLRVQGISQTKPIFSASFNNITMLSDQRPLENQRDQRNTFMYGLINYLAFAEDSVYSSNRFHLQNLPNGTLGYYSLPQAEQDAVETNLRVRGILIGTIGSQGFDNYAPFRRSFLGNITVVNNNFVASAFNRVHFFEIGLAYYDVMNISRNVMRADSYQKTYMWFLDSQKTNTIHVAEGNKTIISYNDYEVAPDDAYCIGNDGTEDSVNAASFKSIEISYNRLHYIRRIVRTKNDGDQNAGAIEFGYMNIQLLHIHHNTFTAGIESDYASWFNTSIFAYSWNTVEQIVEFNTVKNFATNDAQFWTIAARIRDVNVTLGQVFIRNNDVHLIGTAVVYIGISRAIGVQNQHDGIRYSPASIFVNHNTAKLDTLPKQYQQLGVTMVMFLSLAAFSFDLFSMSNNTFALSGEQRFAFAGGSLVKEFKLEQPCSSWNGEELSVQLVQELLAVPMNPIALIVFQTTQEAAKLKVGNFTDGGCIAPTTPAPPPKSPTQKLTLTKSREITASDVLTISSSISEPLKFVPSEDDVKLSPADQQFADGAAGVSSAAAVFVSPTAALDAGRALSIIAIVARCRNYGDNLAKINGQIPAGGTDEKFEADKSANTKNLQGTYAKLYLNRQLSMSERMYMPTICFENAGGDAEAVAGCLKGGVVGGFIFILLGVVLSFACGFLLTVVDRKKELRKKLRVVLENDWDIDDVETNRNRQEGVFDDEDFWKKVYWNAKLPMFIIKSIAIQLSSWMPHALSFLIAHNLPFGDRLLFGVVPVFLCWLFPSIVFCIYLQHAHLSRAFEKKNNSSNFRFLSCYNTKMKREEAMQIEPIHVWFPVARKIENDISYSPSMFQMKLSAMSESLFASANEDEKSNHDNSRSRNNSHSNNRRSPQQIDTTDGPRQKRPTSPLGRKLLVGEYCWSQGQTKHSVNQGGPSSFLKQCSSVINKFYGPLSTDAKRKWFLAEARSKSSSSAQDFDFNLLNENKQEGYMNRSQPWRCRIAPFTVFINSAWAVAACLAQSVAAIHPGRCADTMIVMCIASALAWLVTILCRPNLSGIKNGAVILADTLVLIACVLATFAMMESDNVNSDYNNQNHNNATTTTVAALPMEKAESLASAAKVLLMIAVYAALAGSLPLAISKTLIFFGYIKVCTRSERSELKHIAVEEEEENEEMTSMSNIRRSRKNNLKEKKKQGQRDNNREALMSMLGGGAQRQKNNNNGTSNNNSTFLPVAVSSTSPTSTSLNNNSNVFKNKSNTISGSDKKTYHRSSPLSPATPRRRFSPSAAAAATSSPRNTNNHQQPMEKSNSSGSDEQQQQQQQRHQALLFGQMSNSNNNNNTKNNAADSSRFSPAQQPQHGIRSPKTPMMTTTSPGSPSFISPNAPAAQQSSSHSPIVMNNNNNNNNNNAFHQFSLDSDMSANTRNAINRFSQSNNNNKYQTSPQTNDRDIVIEDMTHRRSPQSPQQQPQHQQQRSRSKKVSVVKRSSPHNKPSIINTAEI